MNKNKKARLVRMRASMKMAELYASFWIARATTGSLPKLTWGSGRSFTREESIKDALETAGSHIQTIETIANNIAALIEEGD